MAFIQLTSKSPKPKTLHFARQLVSQALRPRIFLTLKTLGGTPNRDPCSLWGLIWGLYNDCIRVIYGNGIKGPY